jgi:integrase
VPALLLRRLPRYAEEPVDDYAQRPPQQSCASRAHDQVSRAVQCHREQARARRQATGLRQSEEIGLRINNCDLTKGTIKICEAVVLRQHKDRPKNNEDRTVKLCPRALAVLKRQLALREAYAKAGKIKHDYVFFRVDGKPTRELKYVYIRWRATSSRTGRCGTASPTTPATPA